jgi:hypothetical protein
MKYIFKQIDNISGHNAVTSIEFDADSLPTILEHFEMFLRGSGFHPSGTLDFVEDEPEYCPKFEPAEEEYEEESTVTGQWPFPLTRPTESIYDGDLNSPSAGSGPAVMDWTAAQLIKNAKKDYCKICGINLDIMENQKCWDKLCPKGPDAN